MHFYIDRINNRSVLKMKDWYKLKLQTPGTIKSFSWAKKLIHKAKYGENVASIEVVQVVLVQCNLVDNQYQKKSEVLYMFTPNNSNNYLLNVEPSNLTFLKTYKTEFVDVDLSICWSLTDPNGRLLEIKHKVNLTLLINR